VLAVKIAILYYQICRHSTWRRRGCSVDVIWWVSLQSVTCIYMLCICK